MSTNKSSSNVKINNTKPVHKSENKSKQSEIRKISSKENTSTHLTKRKHGLKDDTTKYSTTAVEDRSRKNFRTHQETNREKQNDEGNKKSKKASKETDVSDRVVLTEQAKGKQISSSEFRQTKQKDTNNVKKMQGSKSKVPDVAKRNLTFTQDNKVRKVESKEKNQESRAKEERTSIISNVNKNHPKEKKSSKSGGKAEAGKIIRNVGEQQNNKRKYKGTDGNLSRTSSESNVTERVNSKGNQKPDFDLQDNKTITLYMDDICINNDSFHRRKKYDKMLRSKHTLSHVNGMENRNESMRGDSMVKDGYTSLDRDVTEKEHSKDKQTPDFNSVTEHMDESSDVNYSLYRRKHYDKMLRENLKKRYAINQVNKRFNDDGLYGKRLESHRTVQTLIKENSRKENLETLRESDESGFSETLKTDNSFDRYDKYHLKLEENENIDRFDTGNGVKHPETEIHKTRPLQNETKYNYQSSTVSIQGHPILRGSPTFIKDESLFEVRNLPPYLDNRQIDNVSSMYHPRLDNGLSYSEPSLFSLTETQTPTYDSNVMLHEDGMKVKNDLNRRLKYRPQIHSRKKGHGQSNIYTEIQMPVSNREVSSDDNKTHKMAGNEYHKPNEMTNQEYSGLAKNDYTALNRDQHQQMKNTNGDIDVKNNNETGRIRVGNKDFVPRTDRYALHTPMIPTITAIDSEEKNDPSESGALVPHSLSSDLSSKSNVISDTYILNSPDTYGQKSPIFEIVFQPNDSETGILVKEKYNVSKNNKINSTHLYLKSGKISAYVHGERDDDRRENEPELVSQNKSKDIGQIVAKSQSEMHMHSDEEHDMLHQQRPYTDSYREPPLFSVGRYEETKVNGMPQYGGVQSKIHKTGNRKGKMVTFFRNGDEYYTGLSLSIKPADFLNFESLLIYLNEKIAVPSGVRYIFSVPDGTEIRSVTDFQQGKSYVVSSTKLPNLEKKYGQSKYALWTNRKMSAGRIRKGEKELFQHTSSPSISTKNKHRVITVKNNLFRNISEKFYINPSTGQNFEDILTTLGDMTHVDIYALYTEKPPHRKVESFSQLFNEFRSHDYFIACGSEMVPLDMDSTKRPAPSSNSSGESVNGTTRKKKSQENNDVDLDEIVENEDKKSPSPVQQRYNETPYDNNEVMTTARKEKDEIIKFDLRGKIREYYDPSITYPDDDGTRPGEKLKLEWIYGFGTKDLLVYPTGELLFYVAAVAVFYRKDDKLDTQRHYLGHTEEISCLTLHPNGFFVASGQYAGKESPAHIRIWDGNKLTTCQVIGIGFFNAGIASIGFSEESCGWYLCAVDTGEKHVLSIWDWEKESNGKLIAKTTTTNKGVACACFYKYDDTLLMTYGTDHLYFWRLFWDPNSEKEGKLYRDKLSGVLHDDFYPKQITAHTFSPTGDVLTGDSNGSIIVWSHDPEYVFRINKEASTVMKNIHKKAVTSLYVMGDNTLLSGGGYSIRSWDCNNFYRPMAIREIPEVTGTVRTIIPQRGIGTDGNIYVGTSRGCVLGGSLPTRFNIIFKGHFDEVWSIASFPDKSAFITAAHDQLVIRWCAITHKAFWRTQVESPCSAIAIDHRGSYVAVGSTAGRFFVLNATNGMHLITVHVGKAQINAMSFSPDDAMLAVGCHDGHIHLFYVHDDGKIYRKNNIILRGHSKFISNLDWSSDSKFLQSADSDFDLLFWNTQRMEKEDGRSLKKCNWSTYSCCAGYPIMGPWTSCENSEHLSVVSRSFNRKVIATGDNRGRIKLFKYPCATHSPACRWTKLYSTTVTALNFINEDSFLISSAGKSPILAQWSVIDTYARK